MKAEVISQTRVDSDITKDSPIVIELVLETEYDMTYLRGQVSNGSVPLWQVLKDLMEERNIDSW